MELQLVAAGLTRTEARARINKIKGTPGAAQDDPTPGAVDPAGWALPPADQPPQRELTP
jgi:hypothetical protein